MNAGSDTSGGTPSPAGDFFSRLLTGVVETRLTDPANNRSLLIVKLNPVAQAILGIAADQLEGKLLDECFPRLHETGLLAVTAEVARSGRMLELEDVLYLDNRLAAAMYRVRIYPLANLGAASVFERIEPQDAPVPTLASQLTAAEMIYAAADAMVSVDAQGILRAFNPAAEEMTGLSADRALGRTFAELGIFTPESLAIAESELKLVLSGQVRPPVELELRNRAGDLLTIEGNARRAVRPAESVYVVLRDATRRKRLEEELLAEERLLRQLLSAHELERKLLAYEIHDGLVQHVTGALMHLETWASLEPPTKATSRTEMEISLQLLRETIAEARRLISGLRPPILDELGLSAAIQYLIDETRGQARQIEIEFSASLDVDRLHPILESSLFRIVQEALHNARRHSGSPRIRIELRQIGTRVRLEVCDWGVGFDPQQIRETRYGLQGIRERARLLHGAATIDSQPGKGTYVCVDVPVWIEFPARLESQVSPGSAAGDSREEVR